MIAKIKTEIRFENLENCEFLCDQDCSLGSIYDFACCLKNFITEKIKEFEDQKPKPDIEPQE